MNSTFKKGDAICNCVHLSQTSQIICLCAETRVEVIYVEHLAVLDVLNLQDELHED